MAVRPSLMACPFSKDTPSAPTRHPRSAPSLALGHYAALDALPRTRSAPSKASAAPRGGIRLLKRSLFLATFASLREMEPGSCLAFHPDV